VARGRLGAPRGRRRLGGLAQQRRLVRLPGAARAQNGALLRAPGTGARERATLRRRRCNPLWPASAARRARPGAAPHHVAPWRAPRTQVCKPELLSRVQSGASSHLLQERPLAHLSHGPPRHTADTGLGPQRGRAERTSSPFCAAAAFCSCAASSFSRSSAGPTQPAVSRQLRTPAAHRGPRKRAYQPLTRVVESAQARAKPTPAGASDCTGGDPRTRGSRRSPGRLELDLHGGARGALALRLATDARDLTGALVGGPRGLPADGAAGRPVTCMPKQRAHAGLPVERGRGAHPSCSSNASVRRCAAPSASSTLRLGARPASVTPPDARAGRAAAGGSAPHRPRTWTARRRPARPAARPCACGWPPP